MQMIASRRVKYPHGPTGREYLPGETFTALSERDAKALFIAGKATFGEGSNKTDLPKEAMPKEVADRPKSGASRRRYQRRDMKAEDGQTGEEASLLSSPPARLPSEPSSED